MNIFLGNSLKIANTFKEIEIFKQQRFFKKNPNYFQKLKNQIETFLNIQKNLNHVKSPIHAKKWRNCHLLRNFL